MKRNFLILFILSTVFAGILHSQSACSGAPAANTAVISATQVCPGSLVTLSLTNAYNNTGIMYQWAYSTASNVGPWTPISGANNASLTTNTLTLPGWYTCVILCSNSMMTTTATAAPLVFGSTTMTNSVPYYEGFQVAANNVLPNCSWAATSLGSNCITYSNGIAQSGNGAAAFSFSNTGTHAFYSNGIQLYAGVIYSISLWVKTNVQGSNTWTDLSIAIGPNQSAVGTNTLITNNNVGSFATFTNLSRTLTVPSSGIYYTGIYGTSAVGTTSAQYLYLDDLSITIPCTGQGAPNTPTVTCNPPAINMCSGSSKTIVCSGAHLYNGSPNNTIVITGTMFPSSGLLTIVGTNTLTGCISTKTVPIFVNPSPNIFVTAVPPIVCAGNSATIIAVGNGGSTLVVTPSVTTTYTMATTNGSCMSSGTVQITVNQNPTITASANATDICSGDEVLVNATGAMVYQYGTVSGSGSYTYAPTTNTVLLVTGFDNKGCMDTALISFKVNACLGLKELNEGSHHYYLYPNPTNGKFVLLSKGSVFNLKVYDCTGKIVMEKTISELKSELNLSEFAKGLYVLQMDSGVEIERIQLLVQ